MLVKNWMSHTVITIDVESSMEDAAKLMGTYNIRGLPVLREGSLVGYITDREIKRASASEIGRLEYVLGMDRMTTHIKVKEFMIRNPIKIMNYYTVEKAAEIMMENKLSSAPVMDREGNLKGVVSQTDVFRALISFIGTRKDGVQFAFQLEDRPGSIKEVTDVIRMFGGRIESILSSSYRVPEVFHKVYIRIYGVDESRRQELKSELKSRFSLLYIVEHRGEECEIWENQ
ncbi:MAG: CBS domain-containing protein [Deltaproteobacteria bacterium]|nr:CBS domain-containing protein [Deltaproteobacteria bacterium]